MQNPVAPYISAVEKHVVWTWKGWSIWLQVTVSVIYLLSCHFNSSCAYESEHKSQIDYWMWPLVSGHLRIFNCVLTASRHTCIHSVWSTNNVVAYTDMVLPMVKPVLWHLIADFHYFLNRLCTRPRQLWGWFWHGSSGSACTKDSAGSSTLLSQQAPTQLWPCALQGHTTSSGPATWRQNCRQWSQGKQGVSDVTVNENQWNSHTFICCIIAISDYFTKKKYKKIRRRSWITEHCC